jgi:hypothetical protein
MCGALLMRPIGLTVFSIKVVKSGKIWLCILLLYGVVSNEGWRFGAGVPHFWLTIVGRFGLPPFDACPV